MHEILLTYDAFVTGPGPDDGITVDRLRRAGSRCEVRQTAGMPASMHIGTRAFPCQLRLRGSSSKRPFDALVATENDTATSTT